MKKLIVLAAFALAVPASAARVPILAAQDLWPLYAPDGEHVAYTELTNAAGRVFALDVVDTKTKRRVQLGLAGYQPSPTWSSDGRIAWSSGGVLYTAAADGSGRKRYLAPAPAYSPAWRPRADELAYLTHHGAQNLDLWVGNARWAANAAGKPAWSPDGAQLAFARDDGIYVATAAGVERKAVAIPNPGPPVWSHDGVRLGFVAGGSLYEAMAVGDTPHLKSRNVQPGSVPAWSADDARLTSGRDWSPRDANAFVLSGPKPGFPGHTVLLAQGTAPLTGTCAIDGTPGADVIEGTQSWGDVIVAGSGNDRIHVGDRHTDRVDCGPGRDTVWADKLDKLSHCEIVHR